MKLVKVMIPAAAIVVATVFLFPAKAGHHEPAYKFDNTHAAFYFRIPHLGFSYTYGRFNDVAAEISLGEKPHDSSFAFTIKADSIDTANEKRDKHLRSPDFFSAKQFPAITYQSTAVHLRGDVLHVDGDLTLHGVTKPLAVHLKKMGEGKDPWGNYRIGYTAQPLKIKRSDFGMDKMPEAVGDEVELMISFEVLRK